MFTVMDERCKHYIWQNVNTTYVNADVNTTYGRNTTYVNADVNTTYVTYVNADVNTT